ncbi:MAG: hypothetical protein GXY33_11765 [Phycisphaerae bacterium]|nr:hypothetical protein [Phycisphaerae bacterium]
MKKPSAQKAVTGSEWKEICLSGSDWRVTHCLPSEYNPASGINVGALGELQTPEWIPAVVPGDVQSDAIDAGLIPDPNYGLNSRACEWTYQRDWVYVRTFSVEKPADPMERVILRFDGVDYACHVSLNGQWLGYHESAWTPFEFDITDRVKFGGRNMLVVTVQHAPDEQCQWGRTSLVRTLKARFAYGWDWCTRLVPLGIWKDVWLVFRGAAHVADVFARPVVDPAGPTASVEVEVTVWAERPVDARARLELSLDGGKVVSHDLDASLQAGKNGLKARLEVPDPQLWWPNGFGEQPVYRLACTLLDAKGGRLDETAVPVGLRKLEWVRNDGAPDDALPYCAKVNGVRVFLKGWNWAPIRQLYGRRHLEAYRRRLELAREAHCVLLRVWGGGLVERPEFYDLCDQFGILVWQETFMSSCCIDNHPSTDPRYIQLLKNEAEQVIPQCRNHPSLAIWCGGNELCVRGDVVDRQGNVLRPEVAGWEGYKTNVGGLPWLPLTSEHPTLAAIKECVNRLDPDRHWLPASGSGPWENASFDYVGEMHDVHGGWMNMGPVEHYRFFNTVDMMLHAEYGCDGSASVRAIEAFVPESHRWPMDKTNTVAWHHGRMWTASNTWRAEELFGKVDDLATYVRASQYGQAEGLRYAMESHRRRKWRCSGAMPWHFAEPWPNVCDTCSVDYYLQPKPAYFALARANRPVHVSAKYETIAWGGRAEFAAEIWGHNALPKAFEGTVTTKVLSAAGDVVFENTKPVAIKPESPAHWDSVVVPAAKLPQGVFMLYSVLTDGSGVEVSHHWSAHSTGEKYPLAPMRELAAAEVKVEASPERITLANTGKVVAFGVWLEVPLDEYVLLSDNWLCLVPGETRRIAVRGQWSRMTLSGWNVAETVVG